ncbi:DUF3871 family protein [Aestuariibaculum sp. M13]|uniref:DUF3871 family protein n=1 Tax=Aestuariibaculum sp. M13 TaxID=2967132 RepID=UPI002159F041|nr:DUF3871 family protein [Aestuariibaculum sp. M13]MCR8667291.1 DUF3871 family protein [Aestuariibaculum sp. M13]
MELITRPHSDMIVNSSEVEGLNKSSFIEANTKKVTLQHLQKDCIIPVFSKDNETTISHYQFINTVFDYIKNEYKEFDIKTPDIRVSHHVKGRIPSAIGKPAKELLEHEKTLYYERCAFVIEIPGITKEINGNKLSLSVGGVRSLAQENLYSKKTLEKFKVFIGFQNKVCLNLCISTDGLANAIRIGSIVDLEQNIDVLFNNYNQGYHLETLNLMSDYYLTEKQFAHFVGKARMYQHLSKSEQQGIFPLALNDSQINSVVKQYYNCPNFGRADNGDINLWNLYNLFTEANKSSYIDFNLERNVNAYELIENLGKSLHTGTTNFFLA